MTVLAWIIIAFTAAQFIVALVNLVTETHLPYAGEIPSKKVSVLIPARNEEKNIVSLLNDLLDQEYRDYEVIVYDDQSEDSTASAVQEFSRKDKRVSLIRGGDLPPGWLGKNHACHSLASRASGDYLLFLDADVRTGSTLLADAVSYSIRSKSELVSIFPMQIIITPGEWATVPNMNYILASLLPLALVRRSPFSSLAAANGQFMLFTKKTYIELLPHQKMKAGKVEDILISRYYKDRGLVTSCLLGDERIACRMYTGFSEAVSGFSKNVAEFFGGSHLVAILFWLVTTFGFIPVLTSLPFVYFTGYVLMYLSARIMIACSGRQDALKNLLYALPLQVSMGMFILTSLRNKAKGKQIWKGRDINC